MLTEARKEEIRKVVAHDDLLHDIGRVHQLGLKLMSAERDVSVHSKDWDQGFMEAKHMIGAWLVEMTKRHVS